jgi:hypothetical protein
VAQLDDADPELTRSHRWRARTRQRYILRVRREAILVAGAALTLAGACGRGSQLASDNPCLALCNKDNSCSPTRQLPCASICTYGGNYYPGLGPVPACTNLEAQVACVNAAVAMSCDAVRDAVAQCPTCPVLDGSPCAADVDCQKYQASFRCDLSRPGGYCTAPCTSPDDCSIGGPEICTASAPPSFDPQAPSTQLWCLLGCKSDASCRAGYHCANVSASLDGYGTCDGP